MDPIEQQQKCDCDTQQTQQTDCSTAAFEHNLDFLLVILAVFSSQFVKACGYVTLHAHLIRRNQPTTRIHSPGEYNLASSRAPACCGPHLADPRPGPCGSGLCVSAPQPFSLTILAISPVRAQPLQSLSARSPEPTKSPTPQPTDTGAISTNPVRVDERSSQSANGEMLHRGRSDQSGFEKGKTAFPDPTRPVWSPARLSALCWMEPGGALNPLPTAWWKRGYVYVCVHDVKHLKNRCYRWSL